MRAMACAPEHGRDGTRQAVYLTRRRGDAEKAEIRGFAPRGPTRRSTPISGTRGQRGLPVRRAGTGEEADGLHRLGRNSEALPALRSAIEICEGLAQHDPWGFGVRQQLVSAYNQMGALLLDMGDAAGAVDRESVV